MMDPSLLTRIIPVATGEDHDELARLFGEIERIQHLFAGFIYGLGNDNRFLYVSTSVETITGHPTKTFLAETGYQFFYSITPPAFRAHVVERAAFYTKQAAEPDFDFAQPLLMEINGGLYRNDGGVSKIRFLAMVLEYTASHDILFTACTWQKVDDLNEFELAASKEKIRRLLTSFKEIYVRLHPDKYHRNGYLKQDMTKVVYPLYKGPSVTKKEYEVLCLISNGCSSKQIAQHLNISFHTAETHRKHLLGKFGAVNTAELMKKASKMFWFE